MKYVVELSLISSTYHG